LGADDLFVGAGIDTAFALGARLALAAPAPKGPWGTRHHFENRKTHVHLIARKIWRHKLITVPVILLMLAGAAYVITVKQSLYEASSTYLMVSPPAAPTAEQIARHPGLAKVKADNPYTHFADQSVVIDVLKARMSSESVRKVLVMAGADPRYRLRSATEFGVSARMFQVKALASTPEGAMRSAEVVGHAVVGELDRMQKARDVDRAYRIKAVQVVAPDGARRKASGPFRMLVGVLGLSHDPPRR
jgi:hypothetical protein